MIYDDLRTPQDGWESNCEGKLDGKMRETAIE